MTSLVSLLRRQAEQAPEAVYLDHLASQARITYRAALETAEGLCSLLASLGVGEGDKVAFIVRNHWMFFPLLFACSARRAALVPVDPELHPDELASILGDAAPVLTIHAGRTPRSGVVDEASVCPLGEVLDALPSIGRREGLDEGVPTDVNLMIYTSGTTGANKCVMLTGENLATMAMALAGRYQIGPTDRLFCTLPTHHMNAVMITGLVPLVGGASVVLSDILSFKNARRYWSSVSEHGVTVCSLVPSIMALLLKLFPEGAGVPLPRLRFGFCGAAPLPEHLWRRFEAVYGIRIYQGYGLTETTCWATSSPPEGAARWDSVGVPLEGCEVRIDPSPVGALEDALFDAGGAAPPPRPSTGEVLIRGPIVSPGYFKSPKLTRESRTQDGFFRTGDLGHFDAEGHLHITGRLKEIIIKNGSNVFSGDIDRVLARHPAVEACKTIGVPDELVGERIVSACVLKEGHEASERELSAWVNAALSRTLWPDAVVQLGYLPAGGAGKIQTNVLRRIVTGALAEEIVAALDRWRSKRAQPSGRERIQEIVQSSLVRGAPISFLTYWGCAARASIAAVDRQALDRLAELVATARRVPQAPPMLTLIFTDTHARNNRISEEQMNGYFAEIEGYASGLGMSVVRMSAILGEAAEGDPEAESKLVAERYPTSIFLTCDHPDFDQALRGAP